MNTIAQPGRMEWVRRLSIGDVVGEPLDDLVDLGLNQIGSGRFEVRAEQFPGVRAGQACRYYIGRSKRFTMLLLQGVISQVESPQAGVTRFHVRERCAALEQQHSIALNQCTALDVLQEMVEATRLTFSTANTTDAQSKYLTTPLDKYFSHGRMLDALGGLGAAFGVADAVWYEQPDGRVFWGSWGQTAMAQSPLPLQGNAIQEKDPSGHAIYIPMVGALRPGMLVQAPDVTFRVEKLRLQKDTMRLEWSPPST